MSWLVANTAVAGVVALVALALGRWLRPAPAVLHALWLFVLLKLVTPPLFPIEVDTSWWQEPRTVVLPFTVDAAGNVSTPVLAARAEGVNVAPAPSPWAMPLALLWGSGSAAMCVWLAVGLVRAQRRLRGCGPVPPKLAREVAQLAADLRVPVPTLCDDPSASSPYVFSFLRTRLVLPARVLAAASAKGRAAVLVHELAHLRRRDHWLAHAELALAIALWWHPLFWFARRQLRQQAELAADAWAIATIPDATIDYATVLVQAAGAPDSMVPMSAVLAARPAAGAAFETRLTMILNENVPCRASRAWWLPFTSLALGLFAVPVQAQSSEQDPVRIEIRINGKEVEALSGAERTALLRKLLAAEEKAEAVAPAKSKSKSKPKSKPEAKGLELELLDVTEDGPAKKSAEKGKSKDKAKGDLNGKHEPRVLRLDGLQSLEGFKGFERLEGLEGLEALGGLRALEGFKAFEAFEGLKGVECVEGLEALEGLEGVECIEGLEALEGLEGLEGLECLEELKGLEGMQILDLSGMREGLAEARLEILRDAELKELGITGDVVRLIDDLGAGKKLDRSIGEIVKKAMRAAKPKLDAATFEALDDLDLKKLGIDLEAVDLALRAAGQALDVKIHVEPIEVTVEGEPMDLKIVEVEPAPKKAKKADKAKKPKLDRREELR